MNFLATLAGENLSMYEYLRENPLSTIVDKDDPEYAKLKVARFSNIASSDDRG